MTEFVNGMKVLEMVRFPLMDAGLLSDVIKDHEVTKVKRRKTHGFRKCGVNKLESMLRCRFPLHEPPTLPAARSCIIREVTPKY